jgi:hypothetical protein
MHVEADTCCPEPLPGRADEACAGPHVECAEDMRQLDSLGLYRMLMMPSDHPAWDWYEAARRQGWVHRWADGSLDAGVARLVG